MSPGEHGRPRWFRRRERDLAAVPRSVPWTVGEDEPDAMAWVDVAQVLDFGRPDAAMIDEWSLVLSSQFLPHRVVQIDGVWRIEVPARLLLQAATEIREYEFEWADEEPEHAPPRPPDNSGTTIWILALFCLWYIFINSDISTALFGPVDWYGLGAADAERIRAGEWWRTLTALTLHADPAHLLSNVAIGGFFLIWLNRRIGSWLGWGLTILAGGLGNLVNAYVHHAQHVSIGASTAVFGTVGIMAGLSVIESRARELGRRLIPAAVGLMLLAMLGSEGENTDLGAHLFGFLAGLPLGCVLGLLRRAKPARK